METLKNIGCALVVLTISSGLAFSQRSKINDEVDALAVAEQNFANEALSHSIKKAFMNVLMEESIVFRPHPVNGRWAYRIDPRPDSSYLFWKPELVCISQGGDFGYSTGPWYAKKSKNSGPVKGFGNFVTVWKKNEAQWKVILDKGVNYSALGERKTILVKKLPHAMFSKAPVQIDSVLAMDSKAYGGAELSYCDDETLFFRHFMYPSKMSDFFKSEVKEYTVWEPLNGEVAPYGDMAYSYGKYETLKEGKKMEGYYLRIWTREALTKWTLALDLRTDN